MEKDAKRERGLSVSDDSMDEEQLQAEHDRLNGHNDYNRDNVGEIVSDDSWDSTSTESSVEYTTRPISHHCKLRLFEWPHGYSPSAHPPSPTPQPLFEDEFLEALPFHVPYAPLRLLTMKTKKKLYLPGHMYPPDARPDFVRALSLQERQAVRNGVLKDWLKEAVIEPAADWASRTLVQGWNARMYFTLPPPKEIRDLADAYQKWNLEDRKLLRIKGRGDGSKEERNKRHAQRRRNKSKKTVDVYETNQYRPVIMCYVPSYLDFVSEPYHQTHAEETGQLSLDNLFYIRFPGYDVPHYYFWTRPGEWSNPTIANPAWDSANLQYDQPEHADFRGPRVDLELSSTLKQPVKHGNKTYIRVKRDDVAVEFPSSADAASGLSTLLLTIEACLVTYGLGAVLAEYRSKWLANGKGDVWDSFALNLHTLYPSGHFPSVPPVRRRHGNSIAVKLASIEAMQDDEDETMISPIRGPEAWTRDDDSFWDVMEVDEHSLQPMVRTEDDIQRALNRVAEENDRFEALYRRSSQVFRKSSEDLDSWLSKISPSPLPSSMSLPRTPTTGSVRTGRRIVPSPRNKTSKGADTCPICHVEWSYVLQKVRFPT
jgi:hypothetical protein